MYKYSFICCFAFMLSTGSPTTTYSFNPAHSASSALHPPLFKLLLSGGGGDRGNRGDSAPQETGEY